jgi:hypothetical protein
MKFKLFRFLSAMVLLCSFTLQVKAQATQTNYFLPTFFPRSPNTTSFEKFGSYEVNLFTGLPSISIPLYTIDAGDIKIPITLSYHASGIKVSDVGSWVGSGWALSAGGTVNRSISGKADDNAVGGYLQGYLKNVNAFSGLTNSDIDSLNSYAMGNFDTRPDIFSYDFPGHGGKFFLDGTSGFVPRLIPFAPVKITYNSTLSKVDIADEHGNVYLFGDTYLESTYTSSQSMPATGSTTGWPLKTIISQNRRDTVNFTYTQQTVYYPDVTSSTDMITDSILVNNTDFTAGYKQGPANISSSYVNEQLNQQINYKNGKVVFVLDTAIRKDLNYSGSRTHALDSIKVYTYNYKSKQMEIQKTIVFFKSNFNPGVNGSMRLKLDSIQILDKAGSVVQHYRFGYNYSITMPVYGSYAKDYWGYYNGKANTSLTPQMTVQTVNASGPTAPITFGSTIPNSRYSDSLYMQAYVLDTIKYPTGGYSVFTYQTNQYMAGGVLQQAGGLRMQSISSYDGINPTPIVKTYQYDVSQARANFYLSNYFFFKTQTEQLWSKVGNSGDAGAIGNIARLRTYVSNPSIDIVPWDAATVVYPHVTEYTGTPTTNIGKTDYYFRDQADNYLYPTIGQEQYLGGMTQTPIVNSYYYARGQLLTKNEFLRKSDGTYQAVRTTTNTYTAFPATTYTSVGLIVVKNISNTPNAIIYPGTTGINCIPAPNNGFAMGNYNIVSDDNYLISTTINIYDINDVTKYTTSTVSYNYGDATYQQIRSTAHTDSRGNTHVTSNKYPFDYLSGTTTHNVLLDSMLNRNMYSTVIEKVDSLHNAITTVNAITGAQYNQYKNGSIVNTIVPSAISTLSVGYPLTNFTHSSVVSGNVTADSRYVQMISFDQYDGQNNLKQYTPRNSTTTSVIWDYLNENPIAQVKNSTSANIAYTSFEADGKGNWSYSGPTVTDPTAPTGSRVYSLSGGAITSPGTDNVHSYILSYWSNNGAATVYFASGYITGTAMATTGGWTYYEHIIPVGNSYVTISGTTTIDELRMYPVGAQMTTYAYDPTGVTAIADTKGGISHFEYDAFQRLKNIRDWYGNIVNNYGYHTYDQTASNDAIAATVFTRDNCPSGTSPQSTTYSVPAGRYYSSTKASANLEAQYDLQTNGQAKADNPANCGCPITTATFTLTNSSGYTGWQAVFTGGTNPTYNFPSSGSSTVQIPAGTYTSVYIGPIGSAMHTFTLGSRTPITGAHSATFNSAVIATSGSTDTSLTVQ